MSVTNPIHQAGHILDLTVTNATCVTGGVPLSDPRSDHYAVHMSQDSGKPMQQQEVRGYCKTRSIDQEAFLDDLKASDSELLVSPPTTLPDLVDQYNKTCWSWTSTLP